MPLEPFKKSDSLTLGVELELQLVNLSNFDLTDACSDMLHLLKRASFPGNVTPEVTESMIEINTDIHTNHTELLEQLQRIRDTLVRAGDTLNVGICGGGTHPFQHWSERKIFARPRFKEVSAIYGYLIKQFTVFGQHIHVGCASGDDALFLLHSLNRYVPHFIALSASSPYFQGVDTQFNSARLNSVFAFPLSGRAPFILTYGLSLYAVSRGPRSKAKVALFKGVLILLASLFVLYQVVYRIVVPVVPLHETMGLVNLLALLANGTCLTLLWKHREEDINMSSVWECSRNDIAANIAVFVAAGGVLLTHSGWPNILVGLALALLFLKSAAKVLKGAIVELRLPG